MVNKEDRARQFLPFDALRGYKEALRKRERIIVEKKTLSEDEIDRISYKINQVKKGMIITCIHYDNGEYIKTEGFVSKVDFVYKYLDIVEKRIYFSDIYDIISDRINDIVYE